MVFNIGQVTVGQVVAGAASDAILGISDRTLILDYIRRALELAVYKANYNIWIDTIDVASDHLGIVTLPSFVGTPLSVNVGGIPTIFRNSWYEFHINGFGQRCGPTCRFSTDMDPSPIFQDLTEWMVLAAICEDATDGNGSKTMIVEGEMMDAQGNIKQAITIPTTGPSIRGVQIPLIVNWANTDPAVTYFRKITRVTKPVTRGYVKLIAFAIRQMATAVTLGYYAPTETNPQYRRLKIASPCKWVRIKYRRSSIQMVDDHDIVPISSYQAMLELLKSVQLADANNVPASEAYLGRAVRLLGEIQSIESGHLWAPLQVDPGFGVGTIDYR